MILIFIYFKQLSTNEDSIPCCFLLLKLSSVFMSVSLLVSVNFCLEKSEFFFFSLGHFDILILSSKKYVHTFILNELHLFILVILRPQKSEIYERVQFLKENCLFYGYSLVNNLVMDVKTRSNYYFDTNPR